MKSSFIIFFVFCSSFLNAEWSTQKIEKSKEIVSEIIDKACVRIAEKYDLHCCGSGLGMCGGPIRHIGLSFKVPGPKTLPQLRNLIVSCKEEVISVVREIPGFQSFSYNSSFGVDNIDIIFYVEGQNGKLFYPEISAVDTLQGNIRYLFNTADSPCYFHEKTIRENYLQAVEIVYQQARS